METMENEDQIQLQMAETRASLADKLETLEQKVVGTVAEATTAVNDTVDVIKDSVQETVAVVNDTVREGVETVKDWFDVPAHVRVHPWAAVGGAVAAGFCLGTFLSKPRRSYADSSMPSYPLRTENPGNSGVRAESPATARTPAPAEPVLSTWSPEIDKLKGLALGVLFGTAREMIVANVSEQVGEQLKEIIDSATKKLGGEPIAQVDWVKKPSEAPANAGCDESRDETAGQRQPFTAYETGPVPGRRW